MEPIDDLVGHITHHISGVPHALDRNTKHSHGGMREDKIDDFLLDEKSHIETTPSPKLDEHDKTKVDLTNLEVHK